MLAGGRHGGGPRSRRPGRAGFRGAGATHDEVDVFAGGGAREEHALERRGAQEASVQVGEDGGEVGGAETRRYGAEVGGGGALADRVDEVAAVGEQDADGVEQDVDVTGRSGGGVILCGIWRGGDGLRVGHGVVHARVLAKRGKCGQEYFPKRRRGLGPVYRPNWAERHRTAAGTPSVCAISRNRAPSSVLVA